MSKITYEDKVTLYENTQISDVNKVKADDMNEIKSVVNGLDSSVSTNATDIATNKKNIGTLSSLNTSSKTDLVSAVNEVNNNVLKPTILYNNTGATAQSSLTLTDTYTNYEYIEIYGARNEMWSYTKFIPARTSSTEFPNVGQNGEFLEIQTTKMKFYNKSVTITGNVITWSATNGAVAGYAIGVGTVIKRIIGWK